MKIITITLNPAFDVYYSINNFAPFRENYVDSTLVKAGGKGINVSRVLTHHGVNNTAYVVMGSKDAGEFSNYMNEDGMDVRTILCEGDIRKNITILSEGIPETRICFNGFTLKPEIFSQLLEEMLLVSDSQTIIVFSGKIPSGISTDLAVGFLQELQRKNGCKIVVDSNSFSLEELVLIKAWLIKPNEQEIESLMGEPPKSAEHASEIAGKISNYGIENIIVSMGNKGAGAASGEKRFIIEVPKIVPLSTVGAGDSMVAGFIKAYVQGLSIERCLKTAAVFGTSACLTQGSDPPTISEIRENEKKITITSL